MRPISTEGFERPQSVLPGATPRLEWLPVSDLVVDRSYQRPIDSAARAAVGRIAQSFSWCCFSPVVVARLENGHYAIIDGQRRTTAAALVGFEKVPCQIVVATRPQQAAACKALNSSAVTISRMAQHAAALGASDDCAIQLANICARADVKLLRYPVPVDRQSPGQTMAIGALAQCRERYGEETLITALQCVTQTANHLPGALSARMIKALCAVLDGDRGRRDSGLALLEAFDAIDLVALENAASVEAVAKKISPVQLLADKIRSELVELLPRNSIGERLSFMDRQRRDENRARIKLSRNISAKRTRESQQS